MRQISLNVTISYSLLSSCFSYGLGKKQLYLSCNSHIYLYDFDAHQFAPSEWNDNPGSQRGEVSKI